MKLLRNPVVVGILAVLALVVVTVQLWPLFNPPGSPAQAAIIPPPEPATKPAPPPAASTLPPKEKKLPGPSIEIAALEAQAMGWTTPPTKDPFQARFVTTNAAVKPASELLTLNAVWRQTQGDLAVVNDRVVAEGDRVLNYKISRIEPDSVWVAGSNGLEQIVFASAAPPTTNATAPVANPRP